VRGAFRPGPGWRDYPGVRVISGNPAGNVGADSPDRWLVARNLALAPALTGEQQQPLTSEQGEALTHIPCSISFSFDEGCQRNPSFVIGIFRFVLKQGGLSGIRLDC
jgi:hypothetical protein